MGYQEIGLQLHNKYRNTHSAPNMTLDKDLSANAKACAEYYAKKGAIDYSCTKKEKAGENLAGPLDNVSDDKAVETAVNSWYNDQKNYKYYKVGFAQNTRHFTQLVWRGSVKLGLGVAKNGKKTFVVALYSPAGNFPGGYPENVRPPKAPKY